MATDPSQLIMGLLQGAGFGRTIADNQQQQAQIGLMSQQQQEAAARMMQSQATVDNDARYHQAVAAYTANPTPRALADLQAQFPDHADALAKSWDTMDAPARQSRQTLLSELFHGAQSGSTDLVVGNITRIRDAERAQGTGTEEADHILAMLADPAQREAGMRAVTAFAQAHLAGSGATSIVSALAPHREDYTINGTRFDAETNKPIVSVSPDPHILSDGQGRIVSVGGGAPSISYGGGDASGAGYAAPGTPGPASPPGGTFNRMIGVESNGRQTTANGQPVTSRRGAIGIAQVMPATAPEAARLAGVAWDPQRYRTDAGYNRQLGEAYFNNLVQQNGGDERLAAAAYNAGPGRVQQAQRIAAARGGSWEQYLPQETREYVANVFGSGGAAPAPGTPATAPQTGNGVRVLVDNGRPQQAPPSGYRWSADGSRQEFIPGGPADPATSTQQNTPVLARQEAQLRREFNSQPEVHTFVQQRANFQTLRTLVQTAPSAQNDIAIVYNYMKLLDPTSVVRESEFASAANATGTIQAVGNTFRRAENGQFLSPEQRQQMLRVGFQYYGRNREAYNATADRYAGLANDQGLNPDHIVRHAVVQPSSAGTQIHQLPRRDASAAMSLPPGAWFTLPGDPPNTHRVRP